MAEPTFADVFCGCGGFSLGFLQAGFRHLWGLDNDRSACATYEANIGKVVCFDAASVDWLSLERPNVLLGSPPCQGFSVAGKRQKDDPRNTLVWGFVWAVAVLRPKAFLMENVPGVGQGDWAQFPSIIRMALETLGYNVSVFKLNAADYGVPQIRKRVFWAGSLEGFLEIPAPTHAVGGMMELRSWVTVREALGIPYDKPSLRLTATEGKGVPLKERLGHGANRASDCLLWVDDAKGRGGAGGPRVQDVSDAPAPLIDSRTGGRPFLWDGYNAKPLPNGPAPSIRGSGTQHSILDAPSRPVLAGNDKGTNPLRRGSSFIKSIQVATADAPSPSVRAGGGHDHTGKFSGGHPPYLEVPHHAINHTGFSLKTHTEPDQSMGGDRLYRRLTVEECLILQGFPQGFKLVGNRTQQYRQVGNAVPPPLAKALASTIKRGLDG